MESHTTNALMIVVALLASFMGTIRALVFGKQPMAEERVVRKSPRSGR